MKLTLSLTSCASCACRTQKVIAVSAAISSECAALTFRFRCRLFSECAALTSRFRCHGRPESRTQIDKLRNTMRHLAEWKIIATCLPPPPAASAVPSCTCHAGAPSRCHEVVEGRPSGRGPGCPHVAITPSAAVTMSHHHHLQPPGRRKSKSE